MENIRINSNNFWTIIYQFSSHSYFLFLYCWIFTNSEKPPDGSGEFNYFTECSSRKNRKNPLFKLKLFFFSDTKIYWRQNINSLVYGDLFSSLIKIIFLYHSQQMYAIYGIQTNWSVVLEIQVKCQWKNFTEIKVAVLVGKYFSTGSKRCMITE